MWLDFFFFFENWYDLLCNTGLFMVKILGEAEAADGCEGVEWTDPQYAEFREDYYPGHYPDELRKNRCLDGISYGSRYRRYVYLILWAIFFERHKQHTTYSLTHFRTFSFIFVLHQS